MSLVQAITSITFRKHLLPADWDISDLIASAPPPPAKAAVHAGSVGSSTNAAGKKGGGVGASMSADTR